MPAMRRKDRRGPGITTRSTVRGADGDGAVPAGPVSGRAAGAARTIPPETMQAQTHSLTRVPAAATDGRREDLIAEHLFRALGNYGTPSGCWSYRVRELLMLDRLPGKFNRAPIWLQATFRPHARRHLPGISLALCKLATILTGRLSRGCMQSPESLRPGQNTLLS